MLALAAQNRLPPPDNEIVQQHAADHHGNHAEIELADPAYSDAADIGGERCVDVHLTNDEFLADTRVTLSTSLDQICFIDGRTRVARRQDVVDTVATRAIGRSEERRAGKEGTHQL